jgi:hypothetical protein
MSATIAPALIEGTPLDTPVHCLNAALDIRFVSII